MSMENDNMEGPWQAALSPMPPESDLDAVLQDVLGDPEARGEIWHGEELVIFSPRYGETWWAAITGTGREDAPVFFHSKGYDLEVPLP